MLHVYAMMDTRVRRVGLAAIKAGYCLTFRVHRPSFLAILKSFGVLLEIIDTMRKAPAGIRIGPTRARRRDTGFCHVGANYDKFYQ